MLWNPSQSDRPGAFLTKRPDQGHKLFRPFRVIFGAGLQVFRADRRPEYDGLREPYLVPPGFRSFGSLKKRARLARV